MYIRLKAPKPWSHLFRRKLLKWRYFDVHLSNRWCLMSGFFTFFLILCSSDLYPFTSPLHLHPYFLWRYYYFWQKGAIISLPRRGHSITTWTKFHPILTPPPTEVDNCGHFTYCLLFFTCTTMDIHWPPLPFFLST